MNERDPAAGRWAVLQVVRLVGVAMVVIGLLHQAGRFPPLDGIPAELGYVLIGIGFVETFYMPLLLARQWKSPPPSFDDPRDSE